MSDLSPPAFYSAPYEDSAAMLENESRLQIIPREELRKQALEQVMRLTTDEALAYRFLSVLDGDRAASAVGKTLATMGVSVMPGDPLLAYGAGTFLDVRWRKHCKPVERSLFAELLFLRDLAGIVPGEEEAELDAFTELEQLREQLGFPDVEQTW